MKSISFLRSRIIVVALHPVLTQFVLSIGVGLAVLFGCAWEEEVLAWENHRKSETILVPDCFDLLCQLAAILGLDAYMGWFFCIIQSA